MPNRNWIESPDDPLLDALCDVLRDLATREEERAWPASRLAACGERGVFAWFVPTELGGLGWSEPDVVRGYLKLSAACLTTTFVITQRTGATKQICVSENWAARARLLPGLLSGETFATVGISHLTTSRRHLGQPALRARAVEGGWRLDGFSPWVTGGCHAQTLVLGANLDDGRQVLVAVDHSSPGIEATQPLELVGLTGSATGEVRLRDVFVHDDAVLDGPVENVLTHRGGTRTGGLQTSTLAVGLSSAALEYLLDEARRRPDLLAPAERLNEDRATLEGDLLAAANGAPTCSHEALRARANSLVLRATQAALSAAKGSGFVAGHPAGRWCREALFFLVWSCPQPVLAANLCELAGLS